MADTTSISQTSIPDYAKPYVERLLGRAESLTWNPYKTYEGERIAEQTGLQTTAQGLAENLVPAGQIRNATSLANQAGLRALGTNYEAGDFNYAPVSSQNFANYLMGPAQQVRTQSFAQPGAAETYMNPYVQNVIAAQQREARRASDISGQQQQAQAVGAGAFGGARDAIMRAERERNLQTQLGDIQASGLNTAYNQAMQQFNTEQQARLAAQQANQQAGLTVGQANLGALVSGAGQNLQAQLANQSAGLQAQQLGEQSRQYGAGLGLQGLQTALQSAGALGNLGATQFGEQAQAISLKNELGTQAQQQQQNILNQQYQDFLNQKQYPYQQLSYLSDMYRGLPLSQTATQVYQAAPSTFSQVAGLGTAALGMAKLAGAKKGGSTEDIKQRKGDGLMGLALAKMA